MFKSLIFSIKVVLIIILAMLGTFFFAVSLGINLLANALTILSGILLTGMIELITNWLDNLAE